MVNSHIVLLGYMGCGKTTISNKLEAILNLPKFDLDQIIEKEYKMSISEIFNKKGQIEFRRIERIFLKKLLIIFMCKEEEYKMQHLLWWGIEQ